jgi:hypothetical protein
MLNDPDIVSPSTTVFQSVIDLTNAAAAGFGSFGIGAQLADSTSRSPSTVPVAGLDSCGK